MFDRRGCLLDCGELLLAAGVGLALAFGCSLAVAWGLRGFVTAHSPAADVLVVALGLLTFLLWAPFSFAVGRALSSVHRHREAARRRRFESRCALSEAEFGRLFPGAAVAIAIGVRAEVERFVGRAGVARRLLPADPVRTTCRLADFDPDDLDWAEFLRSLEARFGARLPDEAYCDATVAQLIGWCAGPTAHSNDETIRPN